MNPKRLAVLLLFCASLGFAQDEKVDPPWMDQVKDAPIFYDVPDVSTVQIVKDVIYEPQEKLAFDLYLPSKAHGKLPVVVLIHGGPLPPNLKTMPKEWAAYKSYGRLVANLGFAAVAVNHRFFGYDKLDQAQQDIDHAIEMIRNDSAKWQIDPDKIIVWGFSGGGCFLCKYLQDPPPYIKAVLSFYGVLDLTPFKKELSGEVSDKDLARYSPARCVQGSKATIPILVVRGGLEDPEMVSGTDLFIKNAIENKLFLTLINYPDARHAFDVIDKKPRTRQVISEALAFLISLK